MNVFESLFVKELLFMLANNQGKVDVSAILNSAVAYGLLCVDEHGVIWIPDTPSDGGE